MTWNDYRVLVISVKDFGAVGDGVADDTTAIATAWSVVSAMNPMPKLVFPPGVYNASSFPNFAKIYAKVIGIGDVTLNYTGSGDAVTLDGTINGSGSPNFDACYYMEFGPFKIQGSAASGNGLRIKSVHHSRIDVNIRGAGTSAAGVSINTCVCTEFKILCSGTPAFVAGAVPAVGILLNDVDWTSYCLFINPIIEGVVLGIHVQMGLGCIFIGGTSEDNSTRGLLVDTPSENNRFIGMDFELNPTNDVTIGGFFNSMIDCDTQSNAIIAAGADFCEIRGGVHSSITLEATGTLNKVDLAIFNRFNDGSVFTDSATDSIISNVTNKGAATVISGFIRWTAWTPNVTAGSGTLGTHTTAGTFLKVGKTVFYTIEIAITTNGTGASYLLINNLPVTVSASRQAACGRDHDIGYMVVADLSPSSTQAVVLKYDGNYPATDGSDIIISGVYECA